MLLQSEGRSAAACVLESLFRPSFPELLGNHLIRESPSWLSETNLTSMHEDSSSIPGPAQCVEAPVLL